jgi:DNA helicase TIP49 (TBP-interacting protein)
VAPQGSPDVLVGRTRELATITTAMTAARRGAARVVHLVGEAGIGKTALAEHAAVMASGQGWGLEQTHLLAGLAEVAAVDASAIADVAARVCR